MIIPPLSVIASWPRPNYVNPESQGPAGVGVGSTLIVLVTITLLLRLYTRRWISKGFGLDDILIACAYVPALAFTVIGIVGERKLGWGRHIWDVPSVDSVTSLKTSLATLILFDAATSLTKLSMLAMLYKLTSASADRKMDIVIMALATLISLNAFIFVTVEVFQCRPLSDYWTPTAGQQNCIDKGTHLEAAGIINTVSDFILVFLPIRTVVGLKLPWKQRIIVLLLFSAGFLACIAGVVRVYFTAISVNDTNFDRTWNAWANWIASVVELSLAIICASIPAIKPFFASYLPDVIETTRRRSRRQTAASVPKEDPEFQGSASRFSYDDKTAPLPSRLAPAFIQQHRRGESIQEAKPEHEDELRLLPTFNSNQQPYQQHMRSPSLQNTPSSPKVQPLSMFVHKRGASLQSPIPSSSPTTAPIRPLSTPFGHRRGASLQENNSRLGLGDEPKTPMDVNKPLPSIRRSQALAERHIGYPTPIATTDIPAPLHPVVYDATEEAIVPPPLALRRVNNGPASTATMANVSENHTVLNTPFQQQRDGVRFSGEETRLSSGPREDRTTVVIMFKGDEEPQQAPPIPSI
ncbi:hypothetical protein PG996_001137 [Apiospora saccharicola]|uniref:Rhodopsin domain-containing protein n=1 Tax=Apiospora saccharicola TaxID=335842 RepID=A0ABR1WIN6_9PEZI